MWDQEARTGLGIEGAKEGGKRWEGQAWERDRGRQDSERDIDKTHRRLEGRTETYTEIGTIMCTDRQTDRKAHM